MGCWVVLAKAVARAEFPSFEIVNALSVFNLSNPKSLDHKTKIERIAKAIGKPVSRDAIRRCLSTSQVSGGY